MFSKCRVINGEYIVKISRGIVELVYEVKYSLKQILIMLNGKIMSVMDWVTKTGNIKILRHLKSQKINLFRSFLYILALNLVFICLTLCQLKTTCLFLMKQKLYALVAF